MNKKHFSENHLQSAHSIGLSWRCNIYRAFSLTLFSTFFILLSLSVSASNPKPSDNNTSSSEMFILNSPATAIFKSESPTVGNSSDFAAEDTPETEKILVVLVDSYGTQNYSKIVITDVNMELSVLIAKDIFDKLPGGIYTVIASSANDLISQKLIIQ